MGLPFLFRFENEKEEREKNCMLHEEEIVLQNQCIFIHIKHRNILHFDISLFFQ
jgi:hypothetical protein